MTSSSAAQQEQHQLVIQKIQTPTIDNNKLNSAMQQSCSSATIVNATVTNTTTTTTPTTINPNDESNYAVTEL